MKIQIITHAEKHYNETKKFSHWHRVSIELSKRHEIDFISKSNWKWFLFNYLKFKPDILITGGVIGYYIFKLKKIGLIRCPIIYVWNDYFTEVMGKKWGLSKIAKMEYYQVENADAITSPSKYLVSIGKNLGKKVNWTQHGVTDNINTEERIKLKSKGKLKILYVGEQSTYKRIDEIIKAVNGLDCDLYLVGKLLNNKFKEIASDNVHFIGFVNPEEVAKWINSVDICIDTQDQDSSLKVTEYISNGKTVIGARGRKSYMFTHLKDIYLTDDFKEAIEYFIKNPKEIKRISDNTKKIKVKKWSEIAKDYEDVIIRTVNRRKK